jgi:2-polyprenyl-3-methyl-5-hydroxy-6-metoxy-1,4-benzoquinol methylase
MLGLQLRMLGEIESRVGPEKTRRQVIAELRELGLTNFALFLNSLPNHQFPKLSQLLPRMAESKVQRSWTGSSGTTLLQQSIDFVRATAVGFSLHTELKISGAKVLDYGCGWGRLARLMYFFVEEDNLFGLDPWDKSIEICRRDGLGDNFRQSDYLPNGLPVSDSAFDLVYAFSVFTHLSERATITNLNVLTSYLSDDGLLVITIRPEEYWKVDTNARKTKSSNRLTLLHESKGFAFQPHKREAVDGDITYGDTSMSLDWIQSTFPDLSVVGTELSMSDSMQRIVFLKKK